MKSKLKRGLAILASAAMCGSMLLHFPSDTFRNINFGISASAATELSTLTFDISEGSILIGDGTISYGNGLMTEYVNGSEITIFGTTITNTITVDTDVSANVTLAGVSIQISDAWHTCAFKIADNSKGDVTVTLADGTENVLKSANNAAGLQKNGNGDVGTLTIQGGTLGTGKLTARSKSDSSFSAAIGGSVNNSTKNITINSGIIVATGTNGAPGIGSGSDYSSNDQLIAENIVINGGTITANGGNGAAGIGGGDNADCNGITINGGTIYATGNHTGAAIGGSYKGIARNITICGGTVFAETSTSAQVIGSGYGVATYDFSPTGNCLVSQTQDDIATITVTGNYELAQNLEIAGDDTLTVVDGANLTIAKGVTLTNSGKIINNGTITIKGALYKNGIIVNNGTILCNAHSFTNSVCSLCGASGGYCGDPSVNEGKDVQWALVGDDESGYILSINGEGAIADYGLNENGTPWYDKKSSITDILVWDGITAIGDYAFANCDNLSSVTIGKDITNIGFYAFNNCKGIDTVVLPDGLITIESGAFSDSSLKTITIPASVTTIDNYALSNYSLETVIFNGDTCEISEYAFYRSLETDSVLTISIPCNWKA